MRAKKLIAAISIVVMLGSAAAPPAAHAHRGRDSGPHPAILAVAGVFALGAVLGLITWLSKHSAKVVPKPLMPMTTSPFDEGQSQEGKMHYGLQCQQAAAEELTLACW